MPGQFCQIVKALFATDGKDNNVQCIWSGGLVKSQGGMNCKSRKMKAIHSFGMAVMLVCLLWVGTGFSCVAAEPVRTESIGLDEGGIINTFKLNYCPLFSTDIADGTFQLVRYEGTSRRLVKGKMVINSSPIGKTCHSAVTVQGSGTMTDHFGLLRLFLCEWRSISLDKNGKESLTGGQVIKTDGNTIAIITKGINFMELQVWERNLDEDRTDRYLERELARVKPILDSLVFKNMTNQ